MRILWRPSRGLVLQGKMSVLPFSICSTIWTLRPVNSKPDSSTLRVCGRGWLCSSASWAGLRRQVRARRGARSWRRATCRRKKKGIIGRGSSGSGEPICGSNKGTPARTLDGEAGTARTGVIVGTGWTAMRVPPRACRADAVHSYRRH